MCSKKGDHIYPPCPTGYSTPVGRAPNISKPIEIINNTTLINLIVKREWSFISGTFFIEWKNDRTWYKLNNQLNSRNFISVNHVRDSILGSHFCKIGWPKIEQIFRQPILQKWLSKIESRTWLTGMKFLDPGWIRYATIWFGLRQF